MIEIGKNDLDRVSSVDQDVLRLDIPVHKHSVRVYVAQVRKCCRDLANDAADLFVCQTGSAHMPPQ